MSSELTVLFKIVHHHFALPTINNGNNNDEDDNNHRYNIDNDDNFKAAID